MHLQKVCNRRLSTLKGIGVVLGIFAALFALTFVTQLMIPLTGSLAAAIVFWGVGALIALWTMRRFVLTYSYALGTNVLRISHAYGRHERIMVQR
jgi:asparagine N-glycosylation enzyme membrane subunit Stt3